MKQNSFRAVRARLFAEALEGRRLLSVTLANGVLNINGGAGNDAYVLTKSGTDIKVIENGGAAKTFAYASVTSINAILAGGNDTIDISNSIVKNAYISGGSGADGLFGGGGDDTIDGGTGNDYVEGRGGYDTLSFASRSEAISEAISVHFTQTDADPLGYTIGASGGAAGEHDTALTTEALAGGSGNDSLGVYVDQWHHELIDPPALPTLRVDGNGGDDSLQGQNAAETTFDLSLGFPKIVMNGGDGNDHFTVVEQDSSAGITLNGGAGDDVFDNPEIDASATITFGTGIDTYNDTSPSGHDYTMPADLEVLHITVGGTVIGNDLDNVITGNASYVDGRGGNDTITMSSSSTILGGGGNDTITGGEGVVHIDGGTGINSVVIDDSASLEGQGYGLTANSLIRYARDTGSPDATIQLLHVTNLSIFGSNSVGNTFEGVGLADANVSLYGGAGDDYFGIYDTLPNSNVNVISGAGDDQLVVGNDDNLPAKVTLRQSEAFARIGLGFGGVLTIAPSSNEANALRATALYVSTHGQLDLTNNPLVVDTIQGTDPSLPASDVNALVRTGRNGGAWDGQGIVSSFAQADASYTLGVALRSQVAGPFPGLIAGAAVKPTSVVVRFTHTGDVNLDRTVNFDDLIILAQNYNATGKSYAQGNIDYSANGIVDFDDLVTVAQNYNAALPSLPAEKSSLSAPAATMAKKKEPLARDVVR